MKSTRFFLMTLTLSAGSLLFFSSCKKENSSPNNVTKVDTAVLAVNFSANSPFTFFSFKKAER